MRVQFGGAKILETLTVGPKGRFPERTPMCELLELDVFDKAVKLRKRGVPAAAFVHTETDATEEPTLTSYVGLVTERDALPVIAFNALNESGADLPGVDPSPERRHCARRIGELLPSLGIYINRQAYVKARDGKPMDSDNVDDHLALLD